MRKTKLKSKMKIFVDPGQMSRAVAHQIIEIVQKKPDAAFGLASGTAPDAVYAELVRLFNEERMAAMQENRLMKFTFRHARFFIPNEFVDVAYDDPLSNHHYFHDRLFNHIDAISKHIFIPDGLRADKEDACRDYERALVKAGGIDFQLFDLGQNGTIALNAPGTGAGTRTRVVKLTEEVLTQEELCFAGGSSEITAMPELAITLGIGTLRKRVKRAVLLINGDTELDLVNEAMSGGINPRLPVSYLQSIPQLEIFVEKRAA